MSLTSLLDFWKRDPETAPNLVAWKTLPPRPAQTHPFPDDLPASIKQTLIAAGIHTLGYLVVTGAVAALVYEKLGLRLLGRAWFNLDLLWGVALILTGAATALA